MTYEQEQQRPELPDLPDLPEASYTALGRLQDWLGAVAVASITLSVALVDAGGWEKVSLILGVCLLLVAVATALGDRVVEVLGEGEAAAIALAIRMADAYGMRRDEAVLGAVKPMKTLGPIVYWIAKATQGSAKYVYRAWLITIEIVALFLGLVFISLAALA
jgi:hypothetical protein